MLENIEASEDEEDDGVSVLSDTDSADSELRIIKQNTTLSTDSDFLGDQPHGPTGIYLNMDHKEGSPLATRLRSTTPSENEATLQPAVGRYRSTTPGENEATLQEGRATSHQLQIGVGGMAGDNGSPVGRVNSVTPVEGYTLHSERVMSQLGMDGKRAFTPNGMENMFPNQMDNMDMGVGEQELLRFSGQENRSGSAFSVSRPKDTQM